MSTYITVAIPYVNSVPHLGYAYELIEADLAARARRSLGEPVRFLGGTDDFSLKNVLAAEVAGEPTSEFVHRHAQRFADLAETLGITFDDFIRTSSDPRHPPAVERLWQRCHVSGDLYVRDYEGLYCVGCEQFYVDAELHNGLCPEHHTPIEHVAERNWFFRLSRHRDRLEELIESDQLLIDPPSFRAEMLTLVRRGLDDISVSRSVNRARGWGLPVPGDPTQVIYVWFDALTNYISALDYGTDRDLFDTWWRYTDERIHVVGKGITRFHAVYWPAFLLSAGEQLPTRIHVHPYLTVDGAKLSKSTGGGINPTELMDKFGADALRWWITRDASATADTNFTLERLIALANEDLANGLGNAVSRITNLALRSNSTALTTHVGDTVGAVLAHDVAVALSRFDRRTATDIIRNAINLINRDIETDAPWRLAREPERRPQLDRLLGGYATRLRQLALAIAPITPGLAEAATSQLNPQHATTPQPVFPTRALRRDVIRTRLQGVRSTR